LTILKNKYSADLIRQLAGFAQIRLRFDVDMDAPQDKVDSFLKLTGCYCVLYRTIKTARRARRN
jgi:uncharacterized OsmC-like protein